MLSPEILPTTHTLLTGRAAQKPLHVSIPGIIQGKGLIPVKAECWGPLCPLLQKNNYPQPAFILCYSSSFSMKSPCCLLIIKNKELFKCELLNPEGNIAIFKRVSTLSCSTRPACQPRRSCREAEGNHSLSSGGDIQEGSSWSRNTLALWPTDSPGALLPGSSRQNPARGSGEWL